MPTNNLLDQILLMLQSFEDEPEQLQKLHRYILEEIYTEEDEEMEAVAIPAHFASLVKDAADSLSAGLVCYINRDTLEKIDIPQSIVDATFWDEEGANEAGEENLFYTDLKRINRAWHDPIAISPPESRESFSFMERFVHSLPESHVRRILTEALSGRKPFRHFNSIIHESDERQSWFAFRQKCLENYVGEILAKRLWNNETDI